MGIPNYQTLKKRLGEMDKELRDKYDIPIQFVEHEPKKAAVLFEYFVLYNTLLACNPEEIIKINLKQRSGPTYLPFPAIKNWKTVSKMGEGLKPSMIIKKDGIVNNFWFDKPLVYFRIGETASIRPDIVIRAGNFKVKENSSSAKFRLLKENEMIAECGVSPDSQVLPEKEYQILEGIEWKGNKKIYLKFKEEFVRPPLIIECKSFGAVLGNIEKYSSYGKNVVVVSPEKLYQPKADNIHTLRLGRQLDNSELREKLIPFLKLVN